MSSFKESSRRTQGSANARRIVTYVFNVFMPALIEFAHHQPVDWTDVRCHAENDVDEVLVEIETDIRREYRPDAD
jgi:hypothetical protein